MNETMGNQQEGSKPSDIELAWLAGLLNGDGCFSLTFRVRKETLKCDLSLTLTQCDPSLIEKSTDILNRLGVNPGITEYPPSGAGVRTKWNLRLSKMAYIGTVIDAIVPFMAGEKLAQAKLMKRYIDRRTEYVNPGNRRWKGGEIANDQESIAIAREFYKARRLEVPKEIATVLNDYPAREYGQVAGSAQQAKA